jgi:hypothetical protein
VQKEFSAAVVAADGDWFALDSSRQTLTLLQSIEFRPDETGAALKIVDREIARITPPFEPRQVFLFSGHMADAADRAVPRFPVGKEASAAQKIAAVLAANDAGPQDLALVQGACGGDILFLEACRERGMRLQLMLPLEEPDFIEHSILYAANGEKWRDRYYALTGGSKRITRIMSDELGPLPRSGDGEEANPYERCNMWLLYSALGWGVDKVRFICLWNGEGGDGRGGTSHMYKEVKRRTGRVAWIDSRTL